MGRPRRRRWGVVVGFLAGFAVLAPSFSYDYADAAGARRARPARVVKRPPARPARLALPTLERDAAIVVDGATGKVLYSRNPDEERYPASLTKMMTLYLLFEALDKGTFKLSSQLTASTHAAAQFPTKLGLKPGDTIDVETAIKAVAVLSANDVAVVVAEAVGGSEGNFAAMMTDKAHALGMTHTNFANASGLPDKEQLTSASDMALLGRHLAYDFPQYFGYFSTPSFAFNRRVYNQHDYLLEQFPGTDGIKTGYTRASGFNLVTSVVRYNKHLVGVVMGGVSVPGRDKEMMQLLSAAFTLAENDRTLLAEANPPWLGGKGPATPPFRKAPPAKSNVAVAIAELAENPPKPAAAAAPPPPAALPTLPAVPVASTDAAPPAPQQPDAAPPTDTRVANVLQPAAPAPQQPEQQLAQGDVTETPPVGDPNASTKRWVIQIGAFATEELAEEQLAAYAQRALNLFQQSRRFVIPFESTDGQTLYRARFGMFDEDEAREICRQMTSRGQTCFAALQFN